MLIKAAFAYAHLFNSHGSLVHARPDNRSSSSAAIVLFLNISHPKFHSSTPPAAMALQYTVLLRFGGILE